jgi:tetratricopeptide (TPR) repeat protein
VCLRAPKTQTLRRTGVAGAMALLLLYTGLTALRAREWDDQLRFSLSEAAKHPQSPRATYDVARNFVILSNFQSDSPYAKRAFVALDQAMQVTDANILPETASILMAARTGRAIQPTWWTTIRQKLRNRQIGPQETSALASLVDCQIRHHCQLPQQEMVQSFAAALDHGENAEILSIFGNYSLNVLHDPNLALRAWERAAELQPNIVQYHVTLANMLIASGRFQEAAAHIDQVRRLGRLGQNEGQARELERSAASKSNEHPLPDVTGTEPRGRDPK